MLEAAEAAPKLIALVWTVRAVSAFVVLVVVFAHQSKAQTSQTRANDIRAAMDTRDFGRAETLVRELSATDAAVFTSNNYDYLLARLLERRGARSEASTLYQALAGRGGILTQYALWHLALIARDSGDLPLERQFITRLLVTHPSSALAAKARERLIDSHFESRTTARRSRCSGLSHHRPGKGRNDGWLGAYSKTGEAESAHSCSTGQRIPR
jgi:hypothetical protein